MKKILQSRVSNIDGDCSRAAWASIFDLELEEVPDWQKESGDDGSMMAEIRWLEAKGYHPGYPTRKHKNSKECMPTLQEIAKFDGGINGYFYASVDSQTFEDVSHAVVVDSDLNIVHDPNPNQLALKLKPEDIIQIITVTDFVIDLDGNIKKR